MIFIFAKFTMNWPHNFIPEEELIILSGDKEQ